MGILEKNHKQACVRRGLFEDNRRFSGPSMTKEGLETLSLEELVRDIPSTKDILAGAVELAEQMERELQEYLSEG